MNIKNKKKHFNLTSFLWDAWCIVSVIGIWPRFIEPTLIQTTRITLPINSLPIDLNNLKILQFSDLHLNRKISDRFLNKFIRKINALAPDIIVFTGDFICYSKLDNPERLKKILCSLKSRYGCFAILGNHDYAEFISINENGDYDVLPRVQREHPLKRGFDRIAKNTTLTDKITEKARNVGLNEPLISLLAETPFALLQNESRIVPVKDSFINICGLGEYMAGRFDPAKAFKEYHSGYPGIILAHNPDCGPELNNYPGDLILSGHTHGGQINLPWLWKRFTLMKNMKYKRGLWKIGNKWLYVNRGIGSVMKFRWFAVPEILLLTLVKA